MWEDPSSTKYDPPEWEPREWRMRHWVILLVLAGAAVALVIWGP